MITVKELKTRFERDSIAYRWGSIASDLLRIANLKSSASFNTKSYESVLTEVKLFTEWLGPDLDPDKQKIIVSLQRQLSEWSFSLISKDVLEKDARRWSRKILKVSELI